MEPWIGAVAAESPILVFLIVASSIISVLYIGRVIEVAYFRDVSKRCQNATDPGWMIMLPVCIMAAAVLYFGIDTTYSADIASEAAKLLIEGLRQ